MFPEYECTKKDKRLLVLLALGALIMLLDLNILLPSTKKLAAGHNPSSWLELQGREYRIYRLRSTNDIANFSQRRGLNDLTDSGLLQQSVAANEIRSGTAMAWKRGNHAQIIKTSVSPRLSFFLGMPFSINSAMAEDLVLVRGIGPALAENILQYREDNGPITSQDELEYVHGIGPKMKQRLNGFFTFTDGGE